MPDTDWTDEETRPTAVEFAAEIGRQARRGADANNPADLPASWLPGASEDHPKPPEYQRAVARKVKNRRWIKTVDMAEVATAKLSELGMDADVLEGFDSRWWSTLAKVSGHPSHTPPSPERRAAVIEKVRADLAIEGERRKPTEKCRCCPECKANGWGCSRCPVTEPHTSTDLREKGKA